MPVKAENLSHAALIPLVAVGVVNLLHSGARLLGFWQEQGEWGFVGDEGVDVAGVAGDQREPGDRASAAAEHMRRHLANRIQHAVVRRRPAGPAPRPGRSRRWCCGQSLGGRR